MNQFLPRGYSVSSDKRIRKMIAEGQDWQIYLTNVDTYALAVKPELYQRWVDDFSLPEGIFVDSDSGQYKLLLSSGNYLISSMECLTRDTGMTASTHRHRRTSSQRIFLP